MKASSTPDTLVRARRQTWWCRVVGLTLAAGLVLATHGVARSTVVPALIKMAKKANPDDTTSPTVFLHWKHQKAFKCYTCHPVLFPTTTKSVATHKAMQKGKYCGACHNGSTAFAHNSRDVECEVCHVE